MSMSQRFANPAFLPRLLLVDGLATGATALLLIVGAQALAPLLGLPAGLLRTAGLLCVPFVAWVLWLSSLAAVPGMATVASIAMNFVWVAVTVWEAFGAQWQPTAWGIAFVCAQALVVLVFAELGWIGVRATRTVRRAMA